MAGNVQVNRHGSVSIGGRGYDAAPAAPTNGATAQEQTDLMARLASLEAVMQQINIDEVSSVPPPPAPRYRAPSTAPAPAYPQYGGACDAPVEVPGEDESDDDLEFNIHGSGGGGAPPASVPQEYGGAVDSFSAAQGDIERDLMAEIDALALSVPSEVAPLAPVAAAPQRHAMQGSIGESTERLESLLNASDMDAYAEQPLPARAASQPSVRVSRHGSISISSLPPPMPPPASLPPTISSYDRAMDDLAALREEQAGYAQEPEKLIDGAPDAVAAIDSLPPRYRADVQALGDLRDLLQLELPSEPPRGNVRGARTKNRDAARSRRSTSTKRAAAGSPARGGRANMSQNVRERRHIRVRPSNVAKPIVRKYRSAESAQKAPRSGGGGARQMETQLLELEADLRLTSLRRDNLDTAVAAEKRELFNKLVQLKNLRTHVDELQDALERVRADVAADPAGARGEALGDAAGVPLPISVPFEDDASPPWMTSVDNAPPPPPPGTRAASQAPRAHPLPAFATPAPALTFDADDGAAVGGASISYGMEELARSNARLERANAEFAALRGGGMSPAAPAVGGSGAYGGGLGGSSAGYVATPTSPWAQRVQNDLVQRKSEELEAAHVHAANVRVNRHGSVSIGRR